MTIATTTMTRAQRKSIAQEYFKRFDTGGDVLALFSEDATVHFPKWGIAQGKPAIAEMFGQIAALFTDIRHYPEYLSFIIEGDVVVTEGLTAGTAANGTQWRPGFSHAGRFVDVFEIRDHLIDRCFIYLDPDYGGEDTARYPWLSSSEPRQL